MAISIKQELTGAPTTSAASQTLGITVTAGNALHVILVTNSGLTGQGVGDGGVNTYTSIGRINDTTNGRFIDHWYVNSLATSVALTLTFTCATTSQWFFSATEIQGTSGYDSSASIPSQGGIFNASAPASANGLATGNFTPSVAPGLMHALAGTNQAIPNVGTSVAFTSQGSGNPNNGYSNYRSEYFRYTATTAFAATFTPTQAGAHSCVAALFKEATADITAALTGTNFGFSI